jgi:hypothetical protein
MKLLTVLFPLDSKTYNASYTILNYEPLEEKELKSTEQIIINTQLTLSQLYDVLSESINELGKNYAESEERTLNVFSSRYENIANELQLLSNRS